MKDRMIVLLSVLFCVPAAFSQTPSPRPAPVRPVRTLPRQADQGLRDLRNLEIRQTTVTEKANPQAIYQKPSKHDLVILAPSRENVDKYAAFLRQPDTGIVKLNANEECANNAEVVAADPNCLKYKIPGGGTAYSFRYESHRIPRLSDLMLKKDVLKTDGVLQQGLMVYLGDIPIDGLSLTSPGMRYLVNFKPASDKTDLTSMDRRLLVGIESDGYSYRLGFYVKNGRTFALRSIAFQGSFIRSWNNIPYDEFTYDKRDDITVVFKVIDVDADGNLTIVWKELARRHAPALKTDGQ